MSTPKYAEKLEGLIDEVRSEVKAMDTKVNGHFEGVAAFRARSETLLAANAEANDRLTQSINKLSDKMEQLSNFRAVTCAFSTVGLALLVSFLGGAFWVSSSVTDLNSTIGSHKEQITEVKSAITELRQSSQSAEKATAALTKQMSESTQTQLAAISAIKNVPFGQVTYREDVIRWILTAESKYIDADGYQFQVGIPKEIDKNLTRNTKASIRMPFLGFVGPGVPFQVSATVDESGKYCTVSLFLPKNVTMSEFLKAQHPRGLPIDIILSVPTE